MIFKDKYGKEIIKLENFYKRYDSEPIFIEADIEVVFKDKTAKESLELELIDLNNLKEFLKEMKKGSRIFFVFENIDQQFKISFQFLNSKNIELEGFLKNKTYTNELNFSFELLETEIDYLITSLERVIASVS